MHCSICARDTHALTCPTCANTALWPKRYDCILVNTDKEKLQRVVDEYKAGPRQLLAEAILQAKEQHRSLERIEEKHRALQEEVKKGKARIAALRAQNDSRRTQLEERNYGLEGRRGDAKDVVEKETARLRQKCTLLASRTSEARNYLCQEAALLYGLRKGKGLNGKPAILLGGLVAPTVADLNGMHYSHLTSVLGYLSHLLVLIAHYLSIKLPNEITLPSRSSPVTTIRNRSSSKSRPLHIPSPLGALAREDSTHFSLFLDAYAMLCHNVSYVCYTQGLVATGIEEVCRPAECLYRLLVLREVTVPKDRSARPIRFGDFSHGTANGFLGNHEGQSFLKGWTVELGDCQDKVRNTVTCDALGSEWDFVDVVESGIEAGPLAETALGGVDGGWMRIKGGRKR
ncbi:hypothetical protein BJ508DRAFT_413326 [Ascobolus immersus RN42]|uniref:Autophagy-related protein 14 n=1 Tax=Ascobolus immersus RN42 TaxID=1160509 RepID=A0A3N4IHI3_ASCIM|nr:hypothetical protein BJ508DRAFT_413326 [Ascobolus immersus RN42]